MEYIQIISRDGKTLIHYVETHLGVSLQPDSGKPMKNSLSSIINHCKGTVTRFTRKNGIATFQ
jgi:hypothetical protein